MKVKVLDGLRGYAALMIVLAHSPQISDSIIGQLVMQALSAFKIGYVGVDIFFVLSGFLITRILIREKREGNFSFNRFYTKRAFRIFPVYYLVLILCGIIFTWDGYEYTSTYLSNYYFSFNDSPHPLRHTWSLAVEEHYYLFWPLIIYFIPEEKIKKYFLIMVLATVIISFLIMSLYFSPNTMDEIVYRATNFRILSISIGSIFALHEQKLLLLISKKRFITLLTLIFIAFYILSISVQRTVLVDLFPKKLLLLFLFSIVSSAIFLIVLSYENSKSLLNYALTNRAIVFIGKISYGIYLFHFPIFYFFGITQNQLDGKWISVSDFIVPISLVFLIPFISFYMIEKPLLDYKNKILGITQNKRH